jgi:hypothetical protein
LRWKMTSEGGRKRLKKGWMMAGISKPYEKYCF